MKYKTHYIVALLLCAFPVVVIPQADWQKLADNILRIDVSEYSQLPADNIFIKKGCRVPQSQRVSVTGEYPEHKGSGHNVIQGEFASKGQKDRAVLCSIDNVSTIIVMWGGPSRCPSVIEDSRARDINYLQGYSKDEIIYSRNIEIVGRDVIAEQHKKHSGAILKGNLEHEGIHDIFEGKASSIYYCNDGRWELFSGSD